MTISLNRVSSPVRIAVAGCGSVFGAYLSTLERLREQGNAELAAVCGPESRRERIRAMGPWPFYPDYQEMLKCADAEAVIILTPMREHAQMAAAALAAGKHVLLEKPLAVSLEEGRETVALARSSPGHLLCAPFTVLSPTFQTIARRLQQGDIGQIVAARGRYGWAGPDWADWFYKPGGGALFDLGVYNLTTLTGWLGPVRRVMAMAGTAVPERTIKGEHVKVEAEDTAQLLLEFGSGCLATILTGFTLQQYRGPGLEVFGTQGTIYMLGDDWDPDGYELWQNQAGCWQCFNETQPEWPWTDGLRHLVDCIRKGVQPVTTPEHAFHVLEVMIQALGSAREGQARLVESTFTPPVVTEMTETVATHRRHDRTRAE